MQTLENLIVEKHNITKCKIIDSKIGRLDVIVEPDITEEEQFLIESTVDEYMGDEWEGFAIVYNTNEYKQ